MKFVWSNIFFLTMLIAPKTPAQQVIAFNNQGWNNNQKLDSCLTLNGFTFTSSENFYTNYGYNFDINSVSLYYLFQNTTADKITIATPDNEPLSLISFAAYQVSEQSSAALIVEGWYNSIIKYKTSFTGINTWKILPLNFNYINKIVIRLDSSANGCLNDYDFDKFTFTSFITSAGINSNSTAQFYELYQNYPNPFNPATVISYKLAADSWVTLSIFDMLGRKVAEPVNEEKQAGTYNFEFNASMLSSGIYFYQIRAVPQSGGSRREFVETKKFQLLK